LLKKFEIKTARHVESKPNGRIAPLFPNVKYYLVLHVVKGLEWLLELWVKVKFDVSQ
jgi:hypothetical protein